MNVDCIISVATFDLNVVGWYTLACTSRIPLSSRAVSSSNRDDSATLGRIFICAVTRDNAAVAVRIGLDYVLRLK